MLPTYPEIVKARASWNREMIKALVHQKSPLLADIPSHQIHEGKGSDMVRVDGSQDQTEIKSHSGSVEIKTTDIGEFDELTVLTYLDQLAEQFAQSMTSSVLQAVSEGAEKVGNVVDGGGRPLSPEILLEAFDQVEIDFGPDGTWQPPTMVVTPQQAERLKEMQEAGDNSLYENRLSDIVERKRLEYRRREAGRVLAG